MLLEQMLHRIPALEDAVYDALINGPETFSADSRWIIGESNEVILFIIIKIVPGLLVRNGYKVYDMRLIRGIICFCIISRVD